MQDADADPCRLERFVAAQDAGGTYRRAVAELRAGVKRGHWMWFVFPQIAGLGFSAISQRYAIGSLAEARAYLAHPVLGPRLAECVRILAAAEGIGAAEIFGDVDAMKLRSSMTLFLAAAPDEPVFREVLGKYFGGEPDDATLERLSLPGGRDSLPGRQVVAVRPRRDVAAVDRQREQFAERVRGAGERRNARPGQRRCVRRVAGRRPVVGLCAHRERAAQTVHRAARTVHRAARPRGVVVVGEPARRGGQPRADPHAQRVSHRRQRPRRRAAHVPVPHRAHQRGHRRHQRHHVGVDGRAGSFRDGHEHRYAGPVRSTIAWYGFPPGPAHDPHTRSAAAPAPLHGPGRGQARGRAPRHVVGREGEHAVGAPPG